MMWLYGAALAQLSDTAHINEPINYWAPVNTAMSHFPARTFASRWDTAGTFRTNWYDHQLSALREPRIFADTTGQEIYRFTWLRTFDNPVALRLKLAGDSALLEWRRTNGAGGYAPGWLTDEGRWTLTPDEVKHFREAITACGFWSMPTMQERLGSDGAHWILEAKLPGGYHIVDRWSPDPKSAYARCCLLLLEYSDLRDKVGNIY